MRARPLAAVAAELGEGPLWHPERGEVFWVDILRGEVHACDLSGNDEVVQVHAEPVGAVALTADGDVLAATPRGLCRSDGIVVAPIPAGDSRLRMNDGKPDPVGRYVGGTMTVGDATAGAGSLWGLDGGVPPRRLLDHVTIPNGLAWSADGTTLYWIDTPTGSIDAFDYDLSTGRIDGRRTVVHIDEALGSPDGMTIDRDGALWVALWGGGAVHRYVDGALDVVIDVPTPFVTCPSFVGPDLDVLVITTASIEFAVPPAGAGDLYIADVGVSGRAPNQLGPWAR